MKRILLAAILLLSGLRVSAQKLTYKFDYAITMVKEVKYVDSTKYKKSRNLVSTLLNGKDRNYLGVMYFDTDSTQNHLTLYDYKNGKIYQIYTHRKEKELLLLDDFGSKYADFGNGIVVSTNFKNTEPDKFIGKYLCEQFSFESDQYSMETWVTRDIKGAPDHSLFAVNMIIGKYPPYFNSVPVLDRFKSPSYECTQKLVGAQQLNHKIIIKGNKLLEFKGTLNQTIDKN